MMPETRSKTFELAQWSLCAGRLEGIIDKPKSGRWLHGVYYMRGSTQCWRRYVAPKTSRTRFQAQARSAMALVVKAWQSLLTDEQRAAWKTAGRHEKSKPRLGQSGPLLGEETYVKHAMVLLLAGKALPLWPTLRPAFKCNPVAGLRLTNGGQGLRIVVELNGSAEEDVLVYGQAACSASRQKWRHGAFVCVLPKGTHGGRDITAAYVGRFGEPAAGNKVFIRVQQQRDGWKDSAWDFAEVVPLRAGAVLRGLAVGSEGGALQESSERHNQNRLSELPEATGGRRQATGPGGKTVRCTRGSYRATTGTTPSRYRRSGRGRIGKERCRPERGAVRGRRRSRFWQEKWHGGQEWAPVSTGSEADSGLRGRRLSRAGRRFAGQGAFQLEGSLLVGKDNPAIGELLCPKPEPGGVHAGVAPNALRAR